MAMPNRDWTPALAEMQRPMVPAASTNHSEVHLNIDLGGIYITSPNGNANDIKRSVSDGIVDGLNRQTRWNLTQLSPAY
jgi:hypothetical protein